MNRGLRLGRLFGIEITVDPSWLFIALLLTLNLGAGVFPALHPKWDPMLNWSLGLAATLLFFASVLAHELAHSLVAKAKGLPVRRITLFMFGGVSNLEREPHTPGVEFLMAIVGPLTSLALGVLFLVLGSLDVGGAMEAVDDPEAAVRRLTPVATMLLWLGPVNLMLGLFNMIPGFPLDGGRVLRSILWARTGDLRRATRWAAGTGQVVAWAFIGTGIGMAFGLQVPFFGTGLLNGLWLAFIGWFLNQAALQSVQKQVVEDLLEGVPVGKLMRAEAPTVSPDLTIERLVDEHLLRSDERAFPVVEDGVLLGIVCLEDVRKTPRGEWPTTRVREVMTPTGKLAVVTPRDDASEALAKLSERDVRQIPVVQDGHVVGILRRRDVLRWLSLHSA